MRMVVSLKTFFSSLLLLPLIYSLFACASDDNMAGEDSEDLTQFDFSFLADSRDGRVYRTVKIGDQVWMAENLNYDTLNGIGSWCYENNGKYCDRYGRLYDWATALTVCPEGWFLPEGADWNALADFLGGKNMAGAKLKTSTEWKNSGGGANSYGFSALPGGFYNGIRFQNSGYGGLWWSSSEIDSVNAVSRFIYYRDADLEVDGYRKTCAYSVRCLKKE